MNKLSLISGFTLVELVISMTMISIALLGTLLAINTATLFSGDPLVTHQSMAIGESYLEEILQKDFPIFPCPSPPSPGGRSAFNNICQYHGLLESPTSQSGSQISPQLNAYKVSVAVDGTNSVLGPPNFPSLTPGSEVVRIDVTVSHPRISGMTFSAYRTKY